MLLAQLLGLLQSPISRMARVLAALAEKRAAVPPKRRPPKRPPRLPADLNPTQPF